MCCTLTFVSCIEEFSPSIDYGERTYINDYQKLVDAVNNLNGTVKERFDALGKLLESGLLNIKLSIDENSGKIEVQSIKFDGSLEVLNQRLSDLNQTLLNGFTALKAIAQENNERLVYAVNAQGELIALHLDQNGQLLEAAVKTQMIEIVKALNDSRKSFEERFAALNELLGEKLLDIKVSVDSLSSKVNVQQTTLSNDLSVINESLKKVDLTLLNGFTVLKTIAQENNERLVYAINANGELVALHLDQNGQLLEAAVKTQMAELVKTLGDVNKSSDERFSALNELLKEKLLALSVSIEALTGKVDVQTKTLSDDLSFINDTFGKVDLTLLNGFTTLKTVMQDNNEMLIYAVSAQGELIALHLDRNGNLIEAAIKTNLVDAVNNMKKTTEERLKALEQLMKEGLTNIKLSIDGQTGKITTFNNTVANGFSALNLTLLNEFEALKTTNKSNSESIVSAINAKGDLIALHVDQNGQLLDATIKTQLSQLAGTLNSNQSTLSQKLSALSTLIETGLGKVEVKVGDVGTALESKLTTANTSLTTINTTLGTLNTNMLSGFTTVDADINAMSSTITVSGGNQNAATATLQQSIIEALGELKSEVNSQGGTIATAVNTNGQTIATAIGSNGELISALQTGVVTAIGTNTTTLEEAIQNTRNNELKDILDEMRNNNDKTETLLNMQNGLKFSEQTYDEGNKTTYAYMHMAPELYQTIMADPTLKKTFQNMLHEVSVPAPESGEYAVQCSASKSTTTVTPSYNNRWTVVDKATPAVVITGTVVVDGHQWLVVRNVCAWTQLKFEMLDNYYPYTFYIEATDAKGVNRALFGDSAGATTGQNTFTTPMTITLYNYDADTGVFYLAEDVSFKTFNAQIE